jgi:hypothetical protein
MIHSGQFSGAPGDGQGRGDRLAGGTGRGHAVNYRLHDWLISRQRYWGAPIPMIYCDRAARCRCPTRTCRCCCRRTPSSCPPARTPLKYHEGFLHTTCPHAAARPRARPTPWTPSCARRGTTMPTSALLQGGRRTPRCPLTRKRGLLAAGGPVHRRHRARHHAPALHPLLHQGHARHGRGRF